MTSPGKIPSLRPIPRKDWAIPLPKWSPQDRVSRPALSYTADLDYQLACRELGGLGFEKIHQVESVDHWQIKYGKGMAAPAEHVLWHHPAGLIAVTHSRLGSASSDGVEKLMVGSLRVYFQLDLGAGPEVAHIGAVRVQGSGSTEVRFDGTTRKVGGFSCLGGRQSLLGFLETCQQYGRLVPVSDWNPENHFLHVPDEMLFPVVDPTPFLGRDIEKEVKENQGLLEEGRKALVAAAPEEVARVVSSSWLAGDFIIDPAPKSREDGFRSDWMSVEYAHKHMGEALFLTGQRFPSDAVRSHVQHWLEVAKGWHGEDMADWRLDEPGPAGMALPSVLLSTMSQASHERLLRMVQERPLEEVLGWVQKPDGAGYVLGQRLLVRAFTGSTTENLNDLEERLGKVFDALVQRVGASAIKMGTELRSALGVWIERLADKEDHELRSLVGREQMAARLLIKMAHAGVEWKVPLKWRTYPNAFASTDKVIRFKSLGERPPGPEEWELLVGMDSSKASVLRELFAWDLEVQLPPAVPHRRGPSRL